MPTKMPHPELDGDDIKRMKKLTLRKLKAVCDQIEQLLAGEDVTLLDLPLPGEPDPEWTKLIRLRMYKKMLNEALARIAEGPYGFCRGCGEPIPKLQLGEMPWAEICQACAAKGVEIIATA